MIFEILLLLAGIYLAWSLGAANAANIIGTAVGSKTLSFRMGILFVMGCLAIGVLFFSNSVIKTISSGIVEPSVITLPHAVVALFTAALWVHFAASRHWPVSINQTVVSVVLGMGIASQAGEEMSLIVWDKILKLFGIWLVSPIIGFLSGILVFRLVHGFVRHRHLYFKDTLYDFLHHPINTAHEMASGELGRREKLFKVLMVLSGGYMAVAMGSSTIASTTGLVYSGVGGDQFSLLNFFFDSSYDLIFVKALVVIGVIVGIATYGKHLVDFIGSRLVKLNPLRGAVIQFTAASVIFICSQFGYPVSTTAVFIGAFLGVDSGEDHPHMKRHAARDLSHSFFVTIPIVTSVSVVLSLGLEWALARW